MRILAKNSSALTKTFFQYPSVTVLSFEGLLRNVRRMMKCNTSVCARYGDYVTFNPGITIRVIKNPRLVNGTFKAANDKQITVTSPLTIRNEEGTAACPRDWNIFIYPIQ
jgi:hypothetical protein